VAILFRDGDGIGAKLYTLFVLGFVAFSLYGLMIGFDPSEVWKGKIEGYPWIAGAVLLVPVFFDKNPKSKLSEKPLGYVLLYFLLTMFAYSTLKYSVPAMHVKLYGVEFVSKARVTSTHRKNGGERGRCKYLINAKDLFQETYWYGLCSNKEFWEAVDRNDRISVSGKETEYGRLVTAFYRE
tara:strand:- start:628 stop:1173 length:546 start_codon:yes stop_codon:yes gene_type:complete